MATQQITRVLNPATEIPICIHARAGRAPRTKLCVHNYECATCPFDQMLDDMVPVVHTLREALIKPAKAA